MVMLRSLSVGMLVFFVAGCQATQVAPRSKPLVYKPSSDSSARTTKAAKQHQGQQTDYSAPVAEANDSDEPTGLEKLSEGTQGFFTRAGQALTPKSDPETSKSAGWGSSSRKTQAKKQKKPSKPSALYRWFHPEPKRPKTLMEFMAQPRLDP